MTGVEGWKTDKSKFLPSISRAWRMAPENRWFVFYEGDTHVVWDTAFRMMANFDADVPHYFGSPSPSRNGTWFANGGPGYIISRGAIGIRQLESGREASSQRCTGGILLVTAAVIVWSDGSCTRLAWISKESGHKATRIRSRASHSMIAVGVSPFCHCTSRWMKTWIYFGDGNGSVTRISGL